MQAAPLRVGRLARLLGVLLLGACTAGSPSAGISDDPAAEPPADGITRYHQVLEVGGFRGPNRIGQDGAGRLYVTEFGGGRVVVLGSDGSVLAEFAGAGGEPGRLDQPTGIAIADDGRVYIGEANASRVSVFTTDGEFLTTWGGFGVGAGEFGAAMGVGIDEALGRVYVADHVNSRIHVYDREGTLLSMFPSNGDFTRIGDGPGEMWLPIGVGVSGDGTVYVVDSGNNRVQTWSADGEPIDSFPAAPLLAPQVIAVLDDGSYWLSGPTDPVVAHFDPSGRQIGELVPPAGGFRSPHGMVVDAEGTVWLTDTGNDLVRAFRVDGDEVATAPDPASPAAGAPAEDAVAVVEAFSFGYEPASVTVSVGDTVAWTNPDDVEHTATVTGLFDSGRLAQGEAFAWTFDTAGEYTVFCWIHGIGLQSGTVTVEP